MLRVTDAFDVLGPEVEEFGSSAAAASADSDAHGAPDAHGAQVAPGAPG